MNKKLVLSVLSTAVVASMAASAMAKPGAGIYIGGSVNKYYSSNALATNLDAAIDEMLDNMDSTVIVDEDGEAALFVDAVNAETAEQLKAVTVKASLDQFSSNRYENVEDPTHPYVPANDPDLLPATGELKVESVSAINAKKIEVKFGAAVSESSAIDYANNYLLTGLSGVNLNGATLVDDKTVVLTVDNPIPNGSTFALTIKPIESKDDSSKKTELFTKTLTFSDTTKPTYVETTYPEAGVAVLKFSEELSTEGTVKIYDGTTDVTSSLSFSLDTNDKSKLNISGLTLNKEYKVVIVGAKDQSNNLISPNPKEVVIKSTVAETVPPTIESISAMDRATLKIKFSEKLKDIDPGTGVKYADVTVGGTPDDGTQTFDDTTNTLTVSLNAAAPAADGVYSVKVENYKDLSDNPGAVFTKAVSFAAGAPVLQKTEVKTISGVKTLVLTFDEAPTLVTGTEITGTYTTPDNVLKTIAAGDLDETTKVSTVGNELRIDISDTTVFGAGTYNLVIPAGGIQDADGTVTTNDTNVTFTLSAGTDTSKPNVTSVFVPGEDATSIGREASVPRNTVYVKYDKSMGASATDANNYTVDGLKVFESAVFVGDKTLVKLTLKDGQITVNGDRDIEISNNVKAENNVALDAYSATKALVENVKPQLQSATLVDGDEIKVKFSEVMEASLVEDNNDFEVIVNGLKKTITGVVADAGAGNDDDEFIITFSTALTPEELTSASIQVKLLADTDATDIASVANPVVGNVTVNVEK